MNIEQLKYIVALDTYRHYVKAAEYCCVTQPTLSMQVQKLEEELSIVIFDRKKTPLIPTKAGIRIIDHARQVLREIEQLKASVKDEQQNIAGEFRLGIIPTLAQYLIPMFLMDFVQHHPDSRLLIEELQTDHIIHQIRHGQLDIGILVTPLEEPDIRETPLFNEPFLAYLSDNHPLLAKAEIHSSDLQEGNLWILNQGHCFRTQVLNICNRKDLSCLQSGFSYESGSIETLKRMVDRHFGFTLVPELSILDSLPHHPKIRRFVSPEPIREISIITHRSFSKSALVEVLRQEILRQVPVRLHHPDTHKRIRWR